MDTYQYRARINPHNDLITLAHYHVGIVKQKVEAGTYEGIRLDGMSAVIAMAFAVEAVINCAGAKAVAGWRERDYFPAKIKALEARLKFTFDAGVEPFRTVSLVKEARNAIAHGQPEPGSSRPRTAVSASSCGQAGRRPLSLSLLFRHWMKLCVSRSFSLASRKSSAELN